MTLLITFCLALALGSASVSSIPIEVDPRIELLTVMEYLVGFQKLGLISRAETEYLSEVEETFRPYAEHPAVVRFAELAGKGLNFDRAPRAMLHLDQRDLSERVELPHELLSIFETRAAWQEWIASVAEFAKESGFWDFFNAHHALYEYLVTSVRSSGAQEIVQELVEYTGEPLERATVVLMPIGHDGGFGPSVEGPEGEEVYALLGPLPTSEGRADFGGKDRMVPSLRHELLHSIVNPMTRRQWGLLEGTGEAFSRIEQSMSQLAYADYEVTVNEHVVRAVTTRIAWRVNGPAKAQKERAFHEGIGFAYLGEIIEALKEYEQKREEYPTLEAFYPRIAKIFRDAAGKTPPEQQH